MNLIPVETPEDFLLAQQFVISYEKFCVSLASYIRRKSENLFFIVESSIPTKISDIFGIIYLDYTIHHCIPDLSNIDKSHFDELLNKAIKKPVRCISGESNGTEFLLSLLSKDNFHSFGYIMMELPLRTDLPEHKLYNGDEIFRCTENEIESLTPLQKDYMKDEVAIPGHKITDAESAIMLRQILKNQVCLAIISNGEIVAKANTNAIGFNCVQIGGVYTHPLFRQNGYASILVTTLCNKIRHAKRNPVLFVKEKNIPAFNLYQKLGFKECGQYTIAYCK